MTDGISFTRATGTTAVLFVCTGNICRSPTAEGVFRRLVEDAGTPQRFLIDSAGTHDYHSGNVPDPRAQAAALERGYDLSGLRARRFGIDDFLRFDYLVCMDRDNIGAVERQRPPGATNWVGLLLDFAPGMEGTEVPDPYYGGPAGFNRVLDLIEVGARALLAHLTLGRAGSVHPD